jgi:hypothetical protein
MKLYLKKFSAVFLLLTWAKVYFRTSSDLLVVGTQELCDYSFVLGKQILQQSYQERSSILILQPSVGVQITQKKHAHMDLPWRCLEHLKQYQSLAAQHTQRTVQSYQISICIWKSTSKSNAWNFTFRKPSAIVEVYLKFSTE